MSSLNRGLRRGTVTLTRGDPSIKGGAPVVLSDTRDGMDGAYTCELATHRLTKDTGIVTTLTLVNTDDGGSFQAGIAAQPDAGQGETGASVH